MGKISLKNVTKNFGDVQVIPPLNLEIEDGEFVVFVGPSGCGKSTLLRMVSGLEDISSGQVLIDDEDATHVRPARRGLAMVFQSYALYPHMTVRNNIAFPLKMAKMAPEEIDQRVNAAAKVLNLADYIERRPGQLSGGQRQRVAIGRAIVREPKAFLFDEPLSNLDAALRVNMRLEISQLHQDLATTMIYVTHDQVEAMTMADKIVVLRAGVVEQVGSPMDLYRNPANMFVAGFIGSPKMNFLHGQFAQKWDAHAIGVRPEHMTLSSETGEWKGTVGIAEHLGADTFLYITLEDGTQITVRAEGENLLKHGDTVYVSAMDGRIYRFDENEQAISAPSE